VIPAAPGPDRRPTTRSAVAIALTLLAAFALVLLIHVLLAERHQGALALLIAVGWTVACAIATSLGSRHALAGLSATAIGLGLVALFWSGLERHVDLVYLLQHAGTHAMLGAWFAGSLQAARTGKGEALITQLALRVHGGRLPPAMVRYTRQVTLLWSGYFLLMALASCGLFAFGSLWAWSLLANVLTLPLVVALFIGEYLVRLRIHPDFDHVSLLDGVRAFMDRPAGDDAKREGVRR
jgi:uncharacterized membrane protein